MPDSMKVISYLVDGDRRVVYGFQYHQCRKWQWRARQKMITSTDEDSMIWIYESVAFGC